jgi:hypothetical protein
MFLCKKESAWTRTTSLVLTEIHEMMIEDIKDAKMNRFFTK